MIERVEEQIKKTLETFKEELEASKGVVSRPFMHSVFAEELWRHVNTLRKLREEIKK